MRSLFGSFDGNVKELLTPVVLFEPFAYAKMDRPSPSGTVEEDPDSWFRYWSACLEDAGIRGLEPWAPGWWLVPVERIRDPSVLRAVVANAFSSWSETLALESIGSLRGGYILSRGGGIVVPGCCGDLGCLENWREAATQTSEDWTRVWIGHPCTYVRASGEVLIFAEPIEESWPGDLKEALSVPRRDLLLAVERATQQRDDLGRRLLPFVQSMTTTIAAEMIVSVLLCGRR